MSGVFQKWQPRYAEHGIATFPLNGEKVPRVKRWQKIGIKGSTELATKFTDADALGFVTGKRSSVTILDIDTTDESVTADAIARHGEPRIITRTASGKHHLFYRYNGEARRIRPWDELEIDVLGDIGFAVAAPSKLIKGTYEIVRGTLDDLAHLQPMEGAPPLVVTPDDAPEAPAVWNELGKNTRRNRELFSYCLSAAPRCRSLDQLVEQAKAANHHFKEPLMEIAEIEKTATSAWKMELEGRNFYSRPRVQLDHDIIDKVAAQEPDAIALLVILERYHGGNETFVMAKPMAAKLGWRLSRWYAARDYLEEVGLIKCIHRGGLGPHDPPRYAWPNIQGVRFRTPI